MKIVLISVLFSCCLVFSAAKTRIIGGEIAAAGQFKFVAAIYKTTADGSFFCGGSLIAPRWVLTAGQCVEKAKLFTIYLGTTNIKTPSSISIKVSTDLYILHPDYNQATLDNDIGLINLKINVEFTDYIGSIGLYPKQLQNVWNVQAVGWGEVNDKTGELSDELRYVGYLNTTSNAKCKNYYGDQITDNMVCVVGNYNQGACHGDTGSPLLFIYNMTHTFVSAVSSFVSANGCESPEPSGYMRLFPYLSWIEDVISDQSTFNCNF